MSERNPQDRNPLDRNPLDRSMAESQDPRISGCDECELMLTDALDGRLTPADSARFEAHTATCSTCSELLAHARSGRQWLQFLHTEPEMPSDLMDRILSRTSAGRAAGLPGDLVLAGAGSGAGAHVLRLPARRMWDNRMLMTAAMAFFSIALTLNLAGVRLTNIRLADLAPTTLGNNLSRQFYGAKSSVVRYYYNLRFVYEVESKMRELKRDEQIAPPPQQSAPAYKNGGRLEPVPHASRPDVLWGHPSLASEPLPPQLRPGMNPFTCTRRSEAGFTPLVAFERGQAERSLA
jgi:hypothetical protein